MEPPKIVTSAIIIENNKVLLVKRKKYPEENKWALPGGLGSFKKYSDPKEVIKDEVKYDLKTEFKIESFHTYSFYTGLEGPMITLHFIGSISNPIPNTESIIEYKYFSKEDIENLGKDNIAFDHYNVLIKYFN